MKKAIFALLTALLSFSVYAVEMPTTAEAKKVLDFYYEGQGMGVVLIDSKWCTEVEKEGDNKNNCKDEVNPASVQTDQELTLWMAFLVPSDDPEQHIIIQFEHNGIARMVKDVTVSGSIRYRTWRSVKFNKAGDWTVKIVHEKGDDVRILSTQTVTVTDPMPAQ